MKSRREEYAATTRAAILEAALEAFAADGFAGASLDEIARRARVTKGALYHHFAGKRELFLAVAEQVAGGVGAGMERAAAEAPGGPEEQIAAAAVAYLESCLKPEVARIMLRDAPAALGAGASRELERRHIVERVERGLEAEMEMGLLERQPADLLARVLLAVLREIGAYTERSGQPEAARREGLELFGRLVAGLRSAEGDELGSVPG